MALTASWIAAWTIASDRVWTLLFWPLKASVFYVWSFQALTSSAARAAVVTASPTSVKPAVMRLRLRVIVFGMVPSLASPSTWLAALATQVKLGSSVNHRR